MLHSDIHDSYLKDGEKEETVTAKTGQYEIGLNVRVMDLSHFTNEVSFTCSTPDSEKETLQNAISAANIADSVVLTVNCVNDGKFGKK